MRAAEPDGPVEDKELPALFAPLAHAASLALAISGGTDSLALLDCVTRWRQGRGGTPDVLVLTVDHGLRKQSKADAAAVVALAQARGLPARVLVWRGAKPVGDIEAAARIARYRLLAEAARAAGASHLLLAHQRDDQAENLLLRLARGSGVFGLAAMRSEIAIGDLVLFRPFLEIGRARLEATVAAAGWVPLVDEMNSDLRYARVRVRKLMPLLAAEGIDPAGLAATARRLADAAEAIEANAGRFIVASVTFDTLSVAAVEPEAFRAAEHEIRRRVLVRLLRAIGGEDYPPRFPRLEALATAMAEHRDGRFKRTLAGAVIEWRSGRFILYREIGRNGLPILSARAGMSAVWDHRFLVEIGADAPAGMKIAALGETGRGVVGAYAGKAVAGVLAALPALWRGGVVRAVPALGYTAGRRPFPLTMRSIVADRAAEPPRFPDLLG